MSPADKSDSDRGKVSANQLTGSLTEGPGCTVLSTMPDKSKKRVSTDIGVGNLGDRGSYLDSGTGSVRRQGTDLVGNPTEQDVQLGSQ